MISAPTLFPPAVESAAGLSPCGLYRYWLTRIWDKDLPLIVFIGLNPSTADALKNDPTIRRCIAFGKAWGFGGLVMLNLFAFRTPYPKELNRAGNPVGPENDQTIAEWSAGRRVIAAWGGCERYAKARIAEVVKLVPSMECLGYTDGGQPRHPLFLPANTILVPFSAAGSVKAVSK